MLLSLNLDGMPILVTKYRYFFVNMVFSQSNSLIWVESERQFEDSKDSGDTLRIPPHSGH